MTNPYALPAGFPRSRNQAIAKAARTGKGPKYPTYVPGFWRTMASGEKWFIVGSGNTHHTVPAHAAYDGCAVSRSIIETKTYTSLADGWVHPDHRWVTADDCLRCDECDVLCGKPGPCIYGQPIQREARTA